MKDKKTSLCKTVIAIGGMHCAACVSKAEKALRAVPGVSEASVNLSTEQAIVAYDELLADIEVLHRAIVDAGL